ncbi:hypothetical protein CW706_04870 [Candidatus Bathyarchaeota archaeon]|nr:MAG: hypothetical protein CW706_04870 [Candidatus Bathyarchaeota archaeon]
MKLKLKIHEGAILAYLEEDGILLPPLLEQSSMMKLVNIVPFYTAVSDAYWPQDDIGITVSKDCLF